MQNESVCGVRPLAMLLVLLLPLASCAGEAVDLGNNDAGLEVGPEGALEGVWVGSVASSTTFLTSPRTLRLDIDGDGHGSLLVGDTPLNPPTDPSVGYPSEAQADAAEASGMLTHLYDGVAYTLRNVTVSGNTLHFELDAFQAFDPWCAIQTPIETDPGVYRCRENWGGRVERSDGQKRCYVLNPNTGVDEEEDCLALFLCSISTSGCHCTASACSASDGGYPQVATFDLQLNEAGTALVGTHTFPDDGLTQPDNGVVLTRQQD